MTGFTKLHMGLMVLVKKMLVPNHFLLQNINLVAVHILLVMSNILYENMYPVII